MRQKHAGISKITPPRLTGVVRRARLFGLLSRGPGPVTWVAGPAGSGKTTLIASWIDARKRSSLWYQLDEGDADIATFFYFMGMAAGRSAPRSRKHLPLFTPEYQGDVRTFTRRFFEDLYARLQPGSVLILDNYHHLPAASPLHEVLRQALTLVPDGISVIISSRGEPPPSLALLRTYGKLSCIGWEDLKFTKEETALLLRGGRKTRPDGEQLDRVHALTTGWAAGVVLLGERLRNGRDLERTDRPGSREFFDYFAAELFDKTGPDNQLFLLKTAFLPTITPQSAATLTGNASAASLLAKLSRNHFFTEQRSLSEPVYQYHPLFREFLRTRAAETLAQDALVEVQRRAGELLEASGRIDDAVECFCMAEAWDKLVLLILANAGSLAAQGRYRSLEERIKRLPPGLIENEPWLLYWLGVCRMPLNLSEGHDSFVRALSLFRKRNDAAGVFRAWSGAVESLVQEMGNITRLDQWISLAFELMKQHDFPSQEIEDEVTARIFTAMPWDPSDRTFVAWRRRAMGLIERDSEPNLRLMTAFYLLAHHIWIGDYSTGRLVLDVIRRLARTYQTISPLASCMGKMCEGWFVWLTGDHAQSYSIMQEALAIADESGVHIWEQNILELGASVSLCMGNTSRAGSLLERMAVILEHTRLFDRFYYHAVSAWRFMMLGDTSQAAAHQQQALDLSARTGFPINASEARFGMVVLSSAQGRFVQAKEHAGELHAIAARMGSALVSYKAFIADAIIALREGADQACVQALREALRLGRERGLVYFKWWVPSLMTDLCVKALETGTEVEQVRHLIRTCGLVPSDPPRHLETWPWPVRIFTLGEFRVLLNDKPVVFPGKVQKKPLELLKALIALGGRDIREDQVHDALWPEAEGDAANTSFRTTLHRLRQLLGNEQAIGVQEGRVNLDPRFCWVDAWAFERLLGPAAGRSDAEDREGGLPGSSLERALSLYRGHFLEADEERSWTISTRERLRTKFLRAVKAQGDRWQQAAGSLKAGEDRRAAFRKAVGCYERGLEVDDVTEELYQDLMLCHQQAGSRAEALKVYKRCRAALSAAFGIEPSEETETIYRNVFGNRS